MNITVTVQLPEHPATAHVATCLLPTATQSITNNNNTNSNPLVVTAPTKTARAQTNQLLSALQLVLDTAAAFK